MCLSRRRAAHEAGAEAGVAGELPMKQEPRLVSEDGGQESEQPPGRTLDEVAAEMPATALVRAVRRESSAAVPFSFFCAGLQGSSQVS